jgi:transcriptional regulator with XRE-family HTH domain
VDFDRFTKRVGANVRRARWAAEMTQQDLASETLTLRLLSALERGRGNPTLHTLFVLARTMKVSVADIVAVEGESAREPLLVRTVSAPKRGRKPKKRR